MNKQIIKPLKSNMSNENQSQRANSEFDALMGIGKILTFLIVGVIGIVAFLVSFLFKSKTPK